MEKKLDWAKVQGKGALGKLASTTGQQHSLSGLCICFHFLLMRTVWSSLKIAILQMSKVWLNETPSSAHGHLHTSTWWSEFQTQALLNLICEGWIFLSRTCPPWTAAVVWKETLCFSSISSCLSTLLSRPPPHPTHHNYPSSLAED